MAEGKQLDAYMIIKSGKFDPIEGESLDYKYGSGMQRGAFEISSFEWGFDNSGSEGKKKKKKKGQQEEGEEAAEAPDAMADFMSGMRKFVPKKFKITKGVDSASHSLLLACCEFPELESVKVIFRKTGILQGSKGLASGGLDYLVFYFTRVRVVSIEWDVKDVVPEETVEFSWVTGQIQYRPQTAEGSGDSQVLKFAGWNLDPDNATAPTSKKSADNVGNWGSRQVGAIAPEPPPKRR